MNNTQYSITDLTGKSIVNGTLKDSENNIYINGHLNGGIYFVKISNGNELFIQKLFVK